MIVALHAFVCTLSCTMVHILCSLCCWAALVQLEEARLLRPHRWLSKVFLSFVLLASRDGSGKPKFGRLRGSGTVFISHVAWFISV